MTYLSCKSKSTVWNTKNSTNSISRRPPEFRKEKVASSLEVPWEVAAACTVADSVENRPKIKNCLEKKDLRKNKNKLLYTYQALLGSSRFCNKISYPPIHLGSPFSHRNYKNSSSKKICAYFLYFQAHIM